MCRFSNESNVENKEQLKKIIEGCLRNDRRSQEAIFKLFYGKMMSVCMRYTNDKDTAQEVLQEGFVKVFEKLGAFDYKGSFEGWVRRIVANTAIDAIRRSKKNPILTDNDNDFKIGGENPMEKQETIELGELKAEMAMEAIQNYLRPIAQFSIFMFWKNTPIRKLQKCLASVRAHQNPI